MTTLLNIGNGENPDRVGDVIFIHGLNGDPKGTWLNDSNTAREKFWPEWLAKDCPTVGIWSIGYSVASSSWKGTAMPLLDRANNILAELTTRGLGTKPLCFIAHSMGGLLVKKMIRNSDSLTPEFRFFSTAVRGIIFLATPHTGSDLARIANYLKFFFRPTIALRELERAAPSLRELNMWYRQHSDQLGIRTQVYFETQKTSGLRVVDEVSADPGLKDVLPIGIDANHITIVKLPSRENMIYQRTKQFVTDLLVTTQPHSDSLKKTHSSEEASDMYVVRKSVPHLADDHPRPYLVPPFPLQGVIGRNKDLTTISAQLALSEKSVTEIPPVALQGMGGVGKTTLALAVGRMEGIRTFFPDGVLWAELGPSPITRTLLNDWGRALGVDLYPERDENACVERLRDILSERRVLLLVDDVWEAEHGSLFHVAGPKCRTLFTTRETPIAHALATRARTFRVNVLNPEDAFQLLARLVPEAVATDQIAARKLCDKLEYLPLALKLAGRLLANEADVRGRMQRLVDELAEHGGARLDLEQREGRKGIDEDHPVSLRAILGLSVHRLTSLDQERFAQLAVFGGEPLTWEINAAAFVWDCSQEESEATTAHLIQRGLIEPRQEDRYQMHALLSDYAAELLEEQER